MHAVLVLAFAMSQDSAPTFSGRGKQLTVSVPRVDTTVVVDGHLDEPIWGRAARLVDFSQYQPVDGRAAEEPTEVLVWYASDAIYFGIRAREVHGDVVRATRANRDNIGSDDQIQILLDTYNDRRIAFLFGVNPLGVQQDGTRSDNFGGGAGGRFSGGGGFGSMNFLDGNIDLNPDYQFESKGRLVEGGYELEIRIPFKTLRYQEGKKQSWGINVLRKVQHSGFQDSWTPAIRASSSFLGQSGTLAGLHDLKRGLVLELTPTVTGHLDGARGPSGSWDYRHASDLSGDVHWGITQNLTMSGTVNPDFSQVEADVGQVLLNQRFALFFPEKRPFFLDGLEFFDTPNQLIYTRQIQAPDGGVKFAGKVGRLNLGVLAAADEQAQSWTGHSTPIFGVARLRTDIGRNSTIGGVLTTREDGADYSRLAGADIRLYHSKLYFVELQAVQSWTDSAGTGKRGPLFQAMWDRTGRSWGFNHTIRAVAPGFDAAAGFVNRTGVIDVNVYNRFTAYGGRDKLIQTGGVFFGVNRLWKYSSPGDGPIEGSESAFPSATLRGGWQLSASITRSFFSYDPVFYTGFQVLRGLADTAAFVIPGPERNQVTSSFSVTTPTYRHFTLSANVSGGQVPIFREASAGRSFQLGAALDLRLTTSLRSSFQLTGLTIDRRRDGSRFSSETIPRLKVEYQVNRAIFVRFIGQYTARDRSALLDRSGRPILSDGVIDPGDTSDESRMDWLFSYRPAPGTLFYLGYGATFADSTDPISLRIRRLERQSDGFFAKASYLFRL
ncbi:MAG: DUF5916 domain-containing protein [Gemmatimonadota bacterium]